MTAKTETGFYITAEGDRWDMIAKKVYGNELAVGLLMQHNGKYLHVASFAAGVKLTVPPLGDTNRMSAPPWRR